MPENKTVAFVKYATQTRGTAIKWAYNKSIKTEQINRII